jgi:hypothetical protein
VEQRQIPSPAEYRTPAVHPVAIPTELSRLVGIMHMLFIYLGQPALVYSWKGVIYEFLLLGFLFEVISSRHSYASRNPYFMLKPWGQSVDILPLPICVGYGLVM